MTCEFVSLLLCFSANQSLKLDSRNHYGRILDFVSSSVLGVSKIQKHDDISGAMLRKVLKILLLLPFIFASVTIPTNQLFQNTLKRWKIRPLSNNDRMLELILSPPKICSFLLSLNWNSPTFSVQFKREAHSCTVDSTAVIVRKFVRSTNAMNRLQTQHIPPSERWTRFVRAKESVEETTTGVVLESLNKFSVLVRSFSYVMNLRGGSLSLK